MYYFAQYYFWEFIIKGREKIEFKNRLGDAINPPGSAIGGISCMKFFIYEKNFQT